MTDMQAHEPELTELLDALCEGTITRDGASRLEALARGDRQARMRYIVYLQVDESLRWDNPADMQEIDDGSADMKSLPVASSASHPSLLGFLSDYQNMFFAVLVVAVLVGAGIVIGSFVSTSRTVEIASTSSVESGTPNCAGWVTGMVDCQWADPRTTVGYGDVPLGSKYALASGLLEITYQSGAKVILQGPAVYKVDSRNGGYLTTGKLTGKLDKTAKEYSDPQFLASNPFAIRTDTATVTDLGTEFGLNVDSKGQNDVHVFDGKVQLETLGTGPRHIGSVAVVMQQESAARVAPTGSVTTFTEVESKAIASAFTRRLAHDDPNIVDLLDVVAGGDGSGWRREQGIHVASGQRASSFPSQWTPGKANYQGVESQPMIDGVFVPGVSFQSPVQLDSVGRTFNGFPKDAGGTSDVIWARAASVMHDGPKQQFQPWIYAMGTGAEYMPRNWGLLALSNVGITFDLQAIRNARRGAKTVQFRATAGQSSSGRASLWVFVDGQVRFTREKLQKRDGPIAIEVSLTSADRFLTLAASEGGNGTDYDRLVLGDPVIELEGAKTKEP